ncbi:MAG: MaoC family dehydratase [Candidatus Rokubacteria bacterium]|nr:MaoC family dehydratase [Candidatus Rokubacteria bacterium]
MGRTIGELSVGESAELARTVDETSIASFVDAVGDYNPVHSDPAYAATTPFKEPIAPGIYTAGLVSAVIGTRLPGPGVIYLSQSLKFSKPVMFGDRITARVEILEILADRNRVRLGTSCTNQKGEEVLSGEAWVMPSKRSVVYEERARAAGSPWMLAPWAVAAQVMAFWGTVGLALLGRPGVTSEGRR